MKKKKNHDAKQIINKRISLRYNKRIFSMKGPNFVYTIS